MIIRSIKASDLKSISELHKRTFDSSHFTAIFPLEKLIDYFGILVNKNKYCFTALDENNKFLGYLVAGSKTEESVAEFSKSNPFFIAKMLLGHPNFLFEKFIFLLKKSFKNTFDDIPQLNIYIIAVDPEIKTGIGQQLLNHFEKAIFQDGLTTYSLSVRNHNQRAINFYLRNGFRKIADNKISSQYIKEVRI